MKENHEAGLKKGGWKWKILALLLIIAIGGSIYLYYWYQDTNRLRQQAQTVIKKAETYDALKSKIKTEYDRCQVFISQQEGSFGNFEYCKGYTNWYKTTNLN
ncbi:hypothetical protein KKA33_01215 [Patescibacteria group bacterium]|nr:hypothetical protein [Patescibacteria group bacterium]